MWVGLCFFLGLQGRIHFFASQSLGASVTPSPSALFHLQSHHVTLTQTCISLPLVRTFQCIRQTQEVFSGPSSVLGRHRRSSQDLQCIRQTQEVFSGPSSVSGRHRRSSQDLPVYQADTGGLLRTFQCIRHTQEVFSGPQSVTGRHRRSSQDLPV